MSQSIIATATNLDPMFYLSGANAKISDIGIDARAAGSNTHGATIAMAAVNSDQVVNVSVLEPCIGVDLNGGAPLIDHLLIYMGAARNCPAIRVGAKTVQAGTVDARIVNSEIGSAGDSLSPGQLILDAGGLYEANDDINGQMAYGTEINPGVNQDVIWAFFSNTVLGDTSRVNSLRIDTQAPTSAVRGLQFSGVWASSAGDDQVFVTNTGRGNIQGLHFVGLRAIGWAGMSRAGGLNFQAGTEITIDDSTVCGFNAGYDNIRIGPAVSTISIRNNTLWGRCEGGGTSGNGINFQGGDTVAVVKGNDFGTGSNTPSGRLIVGTPGGPSVVADNLPLEGLTPTLASASSITIGPYGSYYLAGTATIETINGGGWLGRVVMFTTVDGLAFAAGRGNIIHGVTSPAFGTVRAFWNGSGWLLSGGN